MNTEKDAATALGYLLQSQPNNVAEALGDGRNALTTDVSQEVLDEILIKPGEYYWTYLDRMAWKLNKRTYESIYVVELKQGNVFSTRTKSKTLTQEKYVVTEAYDEASVHDSRLFMLFAINIETGEQLTMQDVDQVTRYKPTKEEAIKLLPYMI